MTLRIESDRQITEDVVNKIRDIFKESNCPNESLSKTFERFTSFTNNTLKLGDESLYEAIIVLK